MLDALQGEVRGYANLAARFTNQEFQRGPLVFSNKAGVSLLTSKLLQIPSPSGVTGYEFVFDGVAIRPPTNPGSVKDECAHGRSFNNKVSSCLSPGIMQGCETTDCLILGTGPFLCSRTQEAQNDASQAGHYFIVSVCPLPDTRDSSLKNEECRRMRSPVSLVRAQAERAGERSATRVSARPFGAP